MDLDHGGWPAHAPYSNVGQHTTLSVQPLDRPMSAPVQPSGSGLRVAYGTPYGVQHSRSDQQSPRSPHSPFSPYSPNDQGRSRPQSPQTPKGKGLKLDKLGLPMDSPYHPLNNSKQLTRPRTAGPPSSRGQNHSRPSSGATAPAAGGSILANRAFLHVRTIQLQQQQQERRAWPLTPAAGSTRASSGFSGSYTDRPLSSAPATPTGARVRAASAGRASKSASMGARSSDPRALSVAEVSHYEGQMAGVASRLAEVDGALQHQHQMQQMLLRPASPARQNSMRRSSSSRASRVSEASPHGASGLGGQAPPSRAAMEDRLERKFGSEVMATLMLHHVKVPEGKLVHYYSALLLLSALPPRLPTTLEQVYAAAFTEHAAAVLAKRPAEQRDAVGALLQVLVAARERLSPTQLAAMGFGPDVLQLLPGWGTLFLARDGLVVAAEPELEAWLMDARGVGPHHPDALAGHSRLGRHSYGCIVAGDVRSVDSYGLRHAVLHLLLSEQPGDTALAEALLLDVRYLQQVYRSGEDMAVLLGLARLPSKTEVVSEVLRWMRAYADVLRLHPRAVQQLQQAAPTLSLMSKALRPPPGSPQPSLSRQTSDAHAAAVAAATGGGKARRASGQPPLPARPPSAAATHAKPLQAALLNPPAHWPTCAAVLSAHSGSITSLSACRSGSQQHMLASTSIDNTIAIWDTSTNTRTAMLPGLSIGGVVSLDFHPSGHSLASSCESGTVHVRDVSGSEAVAVAELRGPQGVAVAHVCYSPDGHLLASVFADGTVSVFNPMQGTLYLKLPVVGKAGVRHACFSPDGQLLALGCRDGTMRLWDLHYSQEIRVTVLRAYAPNTKECPPVPVPVRLVCFSPSGLLLATAPEGGREVKLWDVASGTAAGQPLVVGGAAAGALRALSFSCSGRVLAAAGEQAVVFLWDTDTRGRWSPFAVLTQQMPSGALAFTADGQLLASGCDDGRLVLWDMSVVQQRVAEARRGVDHAGLAAVAPVLGMEGEGPQGPAGAIACMGHSPDGRFLATGMADGGVLVWDAEEGLQVAALRGGHGCLVGRVQFDASGDLLASASEEGAICLWRVPQGGLIVRVGGPPMQRRGGFGLPSSPSAAAMAAASGSSLGLPMPGSPQSPLSPGHRPPSGGRPKSAARATAAQAAAAAAATSAAAGWATLSCSIALRPDARQLAAAHDNGAVRVWALPSGALEARMQPHDSLASVQYSRCGTLLVSVSDQGSVCAWRSEDLEGCQQGDSNDDSQLDPHVVVWCGGHVYGVDVSPDSARIASASRDGNLCVWDAATGDCLVSVPHNHSVATKQSVDGVRYSPGGALLATGCQQDAVVYVWHAETGERLRVLEGVRLLLGGVAGPGAALGSWAVLSLAPYAPFVTQLQEEELLGEAAGQGAQDLCVTAPRPSVRLFSSLPYASHASVAGCSLALAKGNTLMLYRLTL